MIPQKLHRRVKSLGCCCCYIAVRVRWALFVHLLLIQLIVEPTQRYFHLSCYLFFAFLARSLAYFGQIYSLSFHRHVCWCYISVEHSCTRATNVLLLLLSLFASAPHDGRLTPKTANTNTQNSNRTQSTKHIVNIICIEIENGFHYFVRCVHSMAMV